MVNYFVLCCYATFDTVMRLALNNQLSVSIYIYVTVWYRLRYAALYCDVVHCVMFLQGKAADENDKPRHTNPNSPDYSTEGTVTDKYSFFKPRIQVSGSIYRLKKIREVVTVLIARNFYSPRIPRTFTWRK